MIVLGIPRACQSLCGHCNRDPVGGRERSFAEGGWHVKLLG